MILEGMWRGRLQRLLDDVLYWLEVISFSIN